MRLLWARVALIALGGLLGLALITRGAVVIGGIILAVAGIRAVMVGSMVHRRQRLRAARAARRSRANVT